MTKPPKPYNSSSSSLTHTTQPVAMVMTEPTLNIPLTTMSVYVAITTKRAPIMNESRLQASTLVFSRCAFVPIRAPGPGSIQRSWAAEQRDEMWVSLGRGWSGNLGGCLPSISNSIDTIRRESQQEGPGGRAGFRIGRLVSKTTVEGNAWSRLILERVLNGF